MVKNQRNERINAQFKEEIADLLRRAKDPRIGFVSVTEVEVTPDFKQARIYVSVLGDDNAKKATLEGLKSATGYIKSEVAQRIRLRVMPEFEWRYDTSLAHGDRINQLLRQVGLGQGTTPPADPASGTSAADAADADEDDGPEA